MRKRHGFDSRGEGQGERGIVSALSPFKSWLAECIFILFFLESPEDLCIVASSSRITEWLANLDIVWEKFLPQDYKSLVPRWREFSSKKKLYFALIDNGKKRVWLEKSSGKRCIMLPAMDLHIVGGENLKRWRWVLIPEARFGKIAELIQVCWFEIQGRINTHLLSPATRYSAYIVFKKGDNCIGFTERPAKAVIEVEGEEHSRRDVCFDEAMVVERNIVKPKERQDGWMEVELGEFFTEEVLHSNEIKISVCEDVWSIWKRGLIILGIEIRPAKIHYGDRIDRIVMDVPKLLDYIPSERTEIAIDKDSEIVMDVPEVLKYIPPERTEITIDRDTEIVMDIPNVVEYIPPKITVDKDIGLPRGKDGAKSERFCSSDAKTNAHLLDRLFHSKDKTFGIKQHFKELGEKLDLRKIVKGMIIGYLLFLIYCLGYIISAFITLLGKAGGAINRYVVNLSKVLEYIPAERTYNTTDKSITCGAKPARSSSDAKTNADLFDSKITPPQIQVFVSFRGDQLRNNFVGYLVHALQRSKVNVYIDSHEQRGEDLNTLFKRIEGSGIAIVVFSTRYAESIWCLKELVKIKERVHQGLLKVLPIFYNVSPTDVKKLKGKFGDYFRDKEHMYGSDSPLIKAWKKAIVSVTHKHALVYSEKSGALENDFVETIVKEVLDILQSVS